MTKLLTLHFWFQNPPVAMGNIFNSGFFIFFALLAIAAALLSIMSKRTLRDAYDKHAFRMAGSMAGWLSFLGFIWLFCSYEEVQIFGVRGWMLLWALIALACMMRVMLYVRKEVPKLRARNASNSRVNEYLPRRAR